MRETLDSGERRDFETGAKRDTDTEKQRYSDITLDQWNMMLKAEQGVLNFKPLVVHRGMVGFADVSANPEIRVVPTFWDNITKKITFSRRNFSGKPEGFLVYGRSGESERSYAEPLMLNRLQGLMERGAQKYSADNWKKGMPLSVFFNSAVRHLFMWFFGDRNEDHLAAVLFNVQCIMVIERDLYCTQGVNNISKIPEEYADAGILKYRDST